MTQIEANDGTHSMPNPPPDITQLYQSISSLINVCPASTTALELASPLTLIAFLAHAVLVTHQFRLTNTAHQHSPELATDWEALQNSKRSIHATYAHPRSSLSFELSFAKLGDRITISGITVESDKVFTHNLSISGYFDEALFPIRLSKNVVDQGSVGFRTTSHLLDFMTFFINDILHHLLPDLVPTTSPQIIHPNSQQPPSPPPNSAGNSRRRPEDDIPPPLFGSHTPGYVNQQQNPFSIGQSDLDPIGTSDLRIPGMYNRPAPNTFDPLRSRNDGMLVGPHHGIFDHPSSNAGRSIGPSIMQDFFPPVSVPTGARFDPIGPGPGFLPPGRGPRPGNGGFGNDPMGGLGQGLPMGNAYPSARSMGNQGHDFPGYEDMFQ